MKLIKILLCAGLAALALTSCGNDNNATPSPSPTQSPVATASPAGNNMAGKAADNMGNAADDIVDGAGNAVKDATDGVKNAVGEMTGNK